jgi:hypothetical protein
MSAAHLQARAGAAARIATTAVLALLLLLAGWTPARVLPVWEAVGAAQASGPVAGDASPEGAWRTRATAIEAGTPSGQLDAAAAGATRLVLSGAASPRLGLHVASARAVPAPRFRPRAPPIGAWT